MVSNIVVVALLDDVFIGKDRMWAVVRMNRVDEDSVSVFRVRGPGPVEATPR